MALTSSCSDECVCEHVSVCFCLCVCMWRRCAAHACGKNNRFSFHPFIHVSMLTTSSPLPNAMLAKRARGKKKLIEIENECFLRILREYYPHANLFFGRYILFYCFILNILFLLSTLIGIHMKNDELRRQRKATFVHKAQAARVALLIEFTISLFLYCSKKICEIAV